MFTLGKQPVWHDGSFCDLFFDAHLPLSLPPLPASRPTPHQLSKLNTPLHFLSQSLQRVLNAPREILASLNGHDMQHVLTLLERLTDLKDLCAKLPTPGSELFNVLVQPSNPKEKPAPPDVDVLFLDFLTYLTAKVRAMGHHDVLLLPGGWVRPKEAPQANSPSAAAGGNPASPSSSKEKGENDAASAGADGSSASAPPPSTVAASASSASHVPTVNNPSIEEALGPHDLNSGHILFYVLERKFDVFSLTVVNTGNIGALNGLEYHPVSYTGTTTTLGGAEGGSPRLKYQHGLLLEGIPINRVIDSSFWFLLYTPMVYPTADKSTAAFIYERVLPFLNHKPVLNNGVRAGVSTNDDMNSSSGQASPTVDSTMESRMATQQQRVLEAWGSRDGNPLSAACSMAKIPDWQGKPLRGDPTCIHALVHALKYALGLKLNSFSKAQHVLLLLKWEMLRMVGEDLRRVQPNDYVDSEHRLVKLATQVFGMACGVEGTSPYAITPARLLLEMKASVDAINQRSDELTHTRHVAALKTDFDTLDSSEMPLLPTPLSMMHHPISFEPFPLMDRFARSEDIEHLAGGAPPPPIFRPIQFTLIPKVAKNYIDVQLALRHTDHLCQSSITADFAPYRENWVAR
jgi:hypothetical protein